MLYALIKNNKVQNIVVSVDNFTDFPDYKGIYDVIKPLAEGEQVGIGWDYDPATDDYVVPSNESAPAPTITPVWEWYIDIAPFTDRFGSKQLPILMSTNPIVMALVGDLTRRKWIDLKDARVAATLNYFAGVTVSGIGTLVPALITTAEADTILNTPVASGENLALRRLYFNA